jgi:hypothetical protein
MDLPEHTERGTGDVGHHCLCDVAEADELAGAGETSACVFSTISENCR